MIWKKLFGSTAPSKPKVGLPTLPAGFQKTLAQSLGANAIPAMPKSAQRVFVVVTNPDSVAYDFVEAIEGDEGLASRIIKIANSVYFDRGSGSESVVEAVATIGTKELRNILSATSLNALFPTSHALRDQFWEHNLAVAVFSRELAARTVPGKENEAFLGGLLHDIGKLLLLDIDPGRYEEIVKKAGRSGVYCSEEEEIYPFNHTEVGHYIAEQWMFSEDLCSAIRLHHIPSEELDPESLPLIVRTADLIAHKLRIGFPSGMTTLQNNASLKAIDSLKALKITGDAARSLMNEFSNLYEEEKERMQM